MLTEKIILTIKEIQIGQTFSMVLRNKWGQQVHTMGVYTKIADDRLRKHDYVYEEWTLADCGLSPDTEITGTIWGKP